MADDLRLVITILNMTRALNLGREPDFEPIIGANLYKLPSDIDAKVFLFWKELGYNRITKSVPKSLQWSAYHQSSKVSPFISEFKKDPRADKNAV
jgi:hypothetical protein